MRLSLITTFFLFSLLQANGQTISVKAVKAKGDSILKNYIGKNYAVVSPELKEIRTTDKNDTYHYQEYKGKNVQIARSKEYMLTYAVTYPDLNYKDELLLFLNSKFQVSDTSYLMGVPDYIVKGIERDIILPHEAIQLAKAEGLAKGDTTIVYLARHYKTKEFYWHVESAWKKQLAEEAKRNDGRRRRAMNSHLGVNATTRKVITWNEFGNL